MTSASTKIRSPYENRLELVSSAMSSHSSLDDDAADELAIHVLHALDTIPENIR